jgi:hypothetical protein
VPIILKLPEDMDIGTAKIRFTYSASDPSTASAQNYPPNDGDLRLWVKDATEQRTPTEIGAFGGDFVASGIEYLANTFHFDPLNRLKLYLKFRRCDSRLPNDSIFNNIDKVEQRIRFNFVTKYIT